MLITVLKGKGTFYDYGEKEEYEIYALHLPFSPSGKDISVLSKDIEDTGEWRAYEDGKILSFTCEEIEHWGD